MMETHPDPDTVQKVELINRKIDEINQRRYGLHMTKIEDDLDRQELDDYIKSLNLTGEQKKLIEGHNMSYPRQAKDQSSTYYLMMFACVFIEAYLGYAIIEMVTKPSLDLVDTIILYVTAIFFIINAFFVLRYMRIIR